MKILKWVGIGVLALIVLGVIGSMLGGDKDKTDTSSGNTTATTAPPTEQKEATPPPKEKTYQEVTTFKGNGAKKSEPFTIAGDRFKIKYDCKGDLCQAYVKKVGSEFDLQIIMNTTGSAKDETIFYGKGEYYIDSNTIGTYTLVVEDYK